MISLIKSLLFRLLGAETYLKLISDIYFRLYFLHLLENKYPENYFIQKIANKNDHIIDLGANLGYYSIPISNKAGINGKVWAVEPIPLFHKILTDNLRFSAHPENVEIIPYALGKENGKTVEMAVPVKKGVFRHGLTRILQEKSSQSNYLSFNVKIMSPEKLFKDIPGLDLIKCDVEGHEVEIIPRFESILKKFRPLLQIEIGPEENRRSLFQFLLQLQYQPFQLIDRKLQPLDSLQNAKSRDFYFIPDEKVPHWDHLIREKD